ncbi:hypothetical protein BpJC7_22970 [Weizmannia acidilactici]|uniref:Uncharacterized protein n=1 Tax=Weizmannia acidilactici TaxID=2607726 RepID=A0A5J4JPM6_9BACI|nr:hypothetical protein BpJC4_27940 [Weizmannia acidilactici]GER70994.1 hypothetical protein BpJC7_22970 [Weizmannia acidilactici]GER74612.1 hypothetical protein BpPP18_26790 [Weizmannia acidilactici]
MMRQEKRLQIAEELSYVKTPRANNSLQILTTVSREKEMDDLYFRQIRLKIESNF